MKNKRINKNRKSKRAQVAIELTVAFMAMFVLLVASAKVFVWFCDSLTGRQQAFEASRIIDGENQVKPSDVQPLDWQPEDIELVEGAE